MISFSDRQYFEKKLGMDTGYVGIGENKFSNRTFGEFFEEFGIDIHSEIYQECGTSKAKKLRAFWDLEDEEMVKKIMIAMMKYLSGDCQPEYLKDRQEASSSMKEKASRINIYAEQGSSINVGDNNKIQNGKKGVVGEVVEKAVEHFLDV